MLSTTCSVGAKLGAIRGGFVRTVLDTGGVKTIQEQDVWTLRDTRGRRLEIYGSGGWGFQSLRACHRKSPAQAGAFSQRTAKTSDRAPNNDCMSATFASNGASSSSGAAATAWLNSVGAHAFR
ncbi:hypothetical protein BH23ACT5_BH23ACT5_18520 [soil metagenome]